MFAIRVVSDMFNETVYHAYSYSIRRTAISDSDHPTITVALERDVEPHPHDHRALNLVVSDAAFVMNETGKTIDRVVSYYKDPNVQQSEYMPDPLR